MVQRLTYRRRHCYATRANVTRVVKTPGGKNVFQYVKKRATGPSCSNCKTKLPGIPHVRPTDMKNGRMAKNKKTVHRMYGGSMCHACVRERIVRAFLVEEQKIVKKVLKLQQAKEKASK
mmetsp:Transcript_58803/g.187716  ORF Transcript_58803/g.187716 Transcript_58803/m.187716 type:complete len:119 (+) Transcript_58803:941-1297(+)